MQTSARRLVRLLALLETEVHFAQAQARRLIRAGEGREREESPRLLGQIDKLNDLEVAREHLLRAIGVSFAENHLGGLQ